ncbi:MAG: hypothetical protein C0510_13015 [Erythrobacter sp.]|nr:hypothetical protein [Erythrobacter sp.]
MRHLFKHSQCGGIPELIVISLCQILAKQVGELAAKRRNSRARAREGQESAHSPQLSRLPLQNIFYVPGSIYRYKNIFISLSV